MCCAYHDMFWLNERKIYKRYIFFTAGKLVQKEDRAEGAVTLETYKTYMKSAEVSELKYIIEVVFTRPLTC